MVSQEGGVVYFNMNNEHFLEKAVPTPLTGNYITLSMALTVTIDITVNGTTIIIANAVIITITIPLLPRHQHITIVCTITRVVTAHAL